MSTPAVVINYTAKTSYDKPWTCLNCTTLNDPSLINCVSCLERRKGVGKLTIDELGRHQSHTKTNSLATNFVGKVKSIFKPKTPWDCPNCTLKVDGHQKVCSACGYTKKSGESSLTADSTQSCPAETRANRQEMDTTLSSYDIISSTEYCKRGGYQPAEPDFSSPLCSPSHHQPHSDGDHSATSRGHSPTSFSNSTTLTEPSDTSCRSPSPKPLPLAQQPPPSVLLQPPTSYWTCSLCGAFNFIINPEQRCYICSIGKIPQLHVPPRHYSETPHSRGEHNHFLHHQHKCPQPSCSPPQPPLENTYHPPYSDPFPPYPLQDQHYSQMPPHKYAQRYAATNYQPNYPPRPPSHLHGQEAPDGHVLQYHPHAMDYPQGYHRPGQGHRFGVPYSHSQPSKPPERHLENVPSVPRNSDPAYYSRTQVPMAPEHVLPHQQQVLLEQHRSRLNHLPTSPTDRTHGPMKYHRRQSSDEGVSTPTDTHQKTVNSTQHVQAIRREYSLEASLKYQQIQQYCKQHCEPFTDPDFPPADCSLYAHPDVTPPSWGVYRWLRPSSIKDPFTTSRINWTVFRNPGPEDIAQGVLGNCWVLSALAVIAEQPALLEDIMLTKEYSEEGAYQVRLCRDGKWQTVIVDDCFPCYKNNELVFSKARRKQLWVPLIEKALAKLYGSYEALNAGRVLSGLSTLTGLPCEKIYLKRQSPSDEDVDKDFIWAQLLSFRESGCPMGASCGGYDIDQQDYTKVGLEPNHAYSVLDVRCLEAETSLRLIRLRNPWGKFSWRGNWSDTDPIWRSRAYLREELQPRGAEQGIFWIEFTDFMRYFCEVDVCKYRPDWYSTRVPGHLLPFAPSQYSLLACTVTSTTEIDISLYQPSTRGEGKMNLADLAVLVVRYFADDGVSLPLPVSCDLASGSQIQSIVTCSGFLEPGSYAILPLAFNHWDLSSRPRLPSATLQHHTPANYKPYVVALHSSKKIQYQKDALTRPGYLAESIFLLSGRARAKSTPFPNMCLLEVCLKHACRILVAVNEDPHYHFTVSCDASDSANVLSTRGVLVTTDSIPPMHRQVVMLLTQMETSQSYKVFMRIEFHKSRLNPDGDWGALHSPKLFPCVQELHSPRLVST